MENKMIRLLNPEEIECRIGNITKNGVSILLYKDARVDQKILDEVFGPFGWKRSHASIDGNLYCTVSVKDPESGEWVSKQDVGTTGFAEKEKSQASDSFKRACFNWGIGRELYTAPFIWVPAGMVNIQDKNGKLQCYDKFVVSAIGYNDSREICSLAIDNEKGQRMYTMQAKKHAAGSKAQGQETNAAKTGHGMEPGIPAGRLSGAELDLFQRELQRTGVTMRDVEARFKVRTPEEMSPEIYRKVMNALSVTPSADAA